MNLIEHKIIEQTNDINSIQGLLISPSYLLINKEISKKNKTYKQLIVWFDVISNGIKLDYKKIKPTISLQNFKFQLVLNNDNNYQPLMIDKKDIINYGNLEIKHDELGNRIDNDCFLTYEIETSILKDKNYFSYTIEYFNEDYIGLTERNNIGKNKGNLIIDLNDNDYHFSNVVLYNNETLEKQIVIDEDNLKITNYRVNKLHNIDKSIGYIKPDQIHLNNDFINSQNYLKTKVEEVKGSKDNLVIKNPNLELRDSNYLFLKQGSLYNFQTNKIDSSNYESNYFSDNYFVINIEYNYHNSSIKIPISEIESNIKLVDNKSLNVRHYISYANIKINTKFNDFLIYRNLHLNEY